MITLLPFFIVLFAAVFFSELFSRFHFPWVVALLFGGIIIGPTGLDVFTPDATVGLLGQIGLVFLMFMAGLETNLLHRDTTVSFKKISIIALCNALVPFVAAMFVAYLFGFGPLIMLFIGVIAISSSLAAIVPTLEAKQLLHCRVGKSVVSVAIISDIISLVVLSVLLQTIDPATNLPLPVFYILLLITLLILRKALPAVRWFVKKEATHRHDVFQQELRSIFVILLGTVLLFELLGLHQIIAGFFAGLVLSDSIKNKVLKGKLHAISYGIFIPIFFLVIGAQTNFRNLAEIPHIMLFGIVLTTVIIISKLLSGYFAAKWQSVQKQEAMIIGASTIPSLATTLAVAYTGFELGYLSAEMITILVALSMITTLVGAVLVSVMSARYIRDEVDPLPPFTNRIE